MALFLFTRRRWRRAGFAMRRLVHAPRRRILRKALAACGYLAVIVGAHVVAMMRFEGLAADDALWLTVTTLTTVGYGDLSAESWQGRLATTGLLYVGGIFVVAKFAGDFFEFRAARRIAMKTGEWDFAELDEHIILIGSRRNRTFFFSRLVDEFRRDPQSAGREILIVSDDFPDGLPAALENARVRFVRGRGNDPDVLRRAGIDGAHIVVLLAWDVDDVASDGATFDVLHRLRERNREARVVCECLDDANRARLVAAGATVTVRPLRTYPEMIVGAILHPGTSEILENLFTGAGERIERHEQRETRPWSAVIEDYLQDGRGLPLGYRRAGDGTIVTLPDPKAAIDGDAIYVLTRD